MSPRDRAYRSGGGEAPAVPSAAGYARICRSTSGSSNAARAVLGTATETDTVDAALDAIAFRQELLDGISRVRAVGGIRDIYAGDG